MANNDRGLLVHISLLLLIPLIAVGQPSLGKAAEPSASRTDYAEQILQDKPVAFWRFEKPSDSSAKQYMPLVGPGIEAASLAATVHGDLETEVDGPRPVQVGEGAGNLVGHLNFEPENRAVRVPGSGGYLAVDDAGEGNPLAFGLGDTITIEAWVQLTDIREGENRYVVGKGRTFRKGYPKENQNYALRVRCLNGKACVSFLFRDDGDGSASAADWHRWTTKEGFFAGSGWHHIAVSYTFGQPESIRGYVDGVASKGTWDMGGATTKAPVVDDDQLWIGSAMGGSSGNTFRGGIDEVAIYRHAVAPERLKTRVDFEPIPPSFQLAKVPEDGVLVELIEGLPDTRSWEIPPLQPTETFEQTRFAMTDLPRKYSNKGLITDRPHSSLVRMLGYIDVEAGEYELLLRSLGGARVWIDDQVVTTNRFLVQGGSAHGSVPDQPAAKMEGIRELPIGHTESTISVDLKAGRHLVILEALIGGSRVRSEVGELGLFIRQGEDMFTLVSPQEDQQFALTSSQWETFHRQETERLVQWNANRRAAAAESEDAYWAQRHDMARQYIAQLPPIEIPAGDETQSVIDRFINAPIREAAARTAPLTTDDQFLRRIYLDTVGVVPTLAEQHAFQAMPEETRRRDIIDQLLVDPRSADHWVAYWQDVLAENPGILKPTLNNTGPFRWWIHEALSDNKSIDRFATELMMMEGSTYLGGPAGFAMATENDVPMAQKAHIVGQAFLGVEMKCARCHDAPFHESKQEQLFSLAAMLKKSSQQVPLTSSVPGADEGNMLIEVTLKPGSKVEPNWPFAEHYDLESTGIPEGVVRDAKNSREQLAAIVTSPRNHRFAEVIANRIWQVYFGTGIVRTVDDWEMSNPSHPELLSYLARYLVEHDYDLRELQRLILNSEAYQRQVDAELAEQKHKRLPLFAAQQRRRMTAEQVVDSLFVVADKGFDSETLTMDPLAQLSIKTFQNLGTPTRAWQFTSLSNERDRPSLAIPRSQSLVDVLTSFGWRPMRQNPLTIRDPAPIVQQPAILANGVAIRRVVALSDDSVFTRLALESESADDYVAQVMRQILAREPNAEELEFYSYLLKEGFDHRKTGKPPAKRTRLQFAVSWTNHLSEEANSMKIQLEEEVRAGDPPTPQLESGWRERAEDLVWTLVNSPEFVFLP